MQLQFGSRQSYVLPLFPKLAPTEERNSSGPPVLWFATVVLVLIVIGTALLLASWREQHKDSNAVPSDLRGRSGAKIQNSPLPGKRALRTLGGKE